MTQTPLGGSTACNMSFQSDENLYIDEMNKIIYVDKDSRDEKICDAGLVLKKLVTQYNMPENECYIDIKGKSEIALAILNTENVKTSENAKKKKLINILKFDNSFVNADKINPPIYAVHGSIEKETNSFSHKFQNDALTIGDFSREYDVNPYENKNEYEIIISLERLETNIFAQFLCTPNDATNAVSSNANNLTLALCRAVKSEVSAEQGITYTGSQLVNFFTFNHSLIIVSNVVAEESYADLERVGEGPKKCINVTYNAISESDYDTTEERMHLKAFLMPLLLHQENYKNHCSQFFPNKSANNNVNYKLKQTENFVQNLADYAIATKISRKLTYADEKATIVNFLDLVHAQETKVSFNLIFDEATIVPYTPQIYDFFNEQDNENVVTFDMKVKFNGELVVFESVVESDVIILWRQKSYSDDEALYDLVAATENASYNARGGTLIDLDELFYDSALEEGLDDGGVPSTDQGPTENQEPTENQGPTENQAPPVNQTSNNDNGELDIKRRKEKARRELLRLGKTDEQITRLINEHFGTRPLTRSSTNQTGTRKK